MTLIVIIIIIYLLVISCIYASFKDKLTCQLKFTLGVLLVF